MTRPLALLAALALGAGACGDGTAEGSEARVIPIAGLVEVRNGDGWTDLSEALAIDMGQEVRAAERGRARIELPGGGTIELAPGATVRVVEPAMSELLTGSVLASAPNPLTLGLGEIQVEGSPGIFRVDRSFQHRVAVYEGSARVPGSGWDGVVPEFRQVVIVGDTIARDPLPVPINPGDPWDVRLFGEALDIGDSLDRLERGLKAQLGRKSDPKLFARAAPRGVPEGALRKELASRHVAEWPDVFVAAGLAARMAPGLELGPVQTLQRILALREVGASWILVVAQWSLSDSVVGWVSNIAGALASLVGPDPSPAFAADGSPTTSGGAPPPGGGDDGPGDDDDPGPGPGPGPSPSPSPSPTPTDPPPDCDGDAVCEVVSGVTGEDDPTGGTASGGGDGVGPGVG